LRRLVATKATSESRASLPVLLEMFLPLKSWVTGSTELNLETTTEWLNVYRERDALNLTLLYE